MFGIWVANSIARIAASSSNDQRADARRASLWSRVNRSQASRACSDAASVPSAIALA
ncbi:MAG TPA: hypothetical protein VEU08_08275 [Vicinamibacterales bacterium]|nr:hypothetical protein [Vicinamibacterales bacterium]